MPPQLLHCTPVNTIQTPGCKGKRVTVKPSDELGMIIHTRCESLRVTNLLTLRIFVDEDSVVAYGTDCMALVHGIVIVMVVAVIALFNKDSAVVGKEKRGKMFSIKPGNVTIGNIITSLVLCY